MDFTHEDAGCRGELVDEISARHIIRDVTVNTVIPYRLLFGKFDPFAGRIIVVVLVIFGELLARFCEKHRKLLSAVCCQKKLT